MPSEFESRRARVLERLGSGVLLVPAQAVALRNNDVEHEYRQDSDFYYLTGFEEPEALLVLSGSSEQPFTLFLRPKDPERERWDGFRLGPEAALSVLGANQAFAIGELEKRLGDILSGHEELYYELGRFPDIDRMVFAAVRNLRRRARLGVTWPKSIIEPSTLVHELRLLKDDRELQLIQRAADITCRAHEAAMRVAQPDMFEYEIEATLRSEFRRAGAGRLAFAPIVASGTNATILHYVRNECRIGENDLVLVDAGCEYGYYAADVTRTFPASGRFTPAQRAIYEIVLAAQKASIGAVATGATLDTVHQAAVHVLVDGMLSVGLLKGERSEILEQKTYQKYFMHRTSHWLGMDVHDVGPYTRSGRQIALEAGMLLTVEPGLYIDADADVPAEFRGIGVRIEDDVLVSANGARVITSGAPTSIDAIEEVCGSGPPPERGQSG